MADPADDPAPESSRDASIDAAGDTYPAENADEAQSTATPAAHTTDRRTLSPSVQLIWAVRVAITLAVLGVIGVVVAQQVTDDPTLVLSGVGVLAVLALVWVHLRYRVWSFRVREDALYLERGVVTNVKTVAPHVRIQHVDTSRGPIERSLGLSTLVVYTAGSRGADVSIPGLVPEEASDLQQRVKQLSIDADGDDAL